MSAVKPLENIMDTAKHMYLKDFRNHAKKSGLNHTLTRHRRGGAYTVFVPENKAFRKVPQSTRYVCISIWALLSYFFASSSTVVPAV